MRPGRESHGRQGLRLPRLRTSRLRPELDESEALASDAFLYMAEVRLGAGLVKVATDVSEEGVTLQELHQGP